jgi:ABC-type bacteriocin/lantibiotic exporter with double-glycine peptidase domain
MSESLPADVSEKDSMLNSFRRFWRLLREDILKEKKRLLSGLFFALVAGLFAVTIPYVIHLLIDQAIPEKNLDLLGRYTLALFAAMALAGLLRYAQVSLIARASENIFLTFKLRLTDSILHKKLPFYTQFQSSDLLTRMVADLALAFDFFSKYLINSLVELVFVVVIVTFILFLDWQLALIAIIGMPILGSILAILESAIASTSGLSRQRLSDQNQRMLDILQGHKEIRVFQQHKKIAALAGSVFTDYAEASFRFNRVMGIAQFMLEMAGVFILFLPVVIGGFAIIQGSEDITIGMIVAFQTFLVMLSDSANKISISLAELLKVTPAVRRLTEILDYPRDTQVEVLDWIHVPDSMAIEYRHVSFGYSAEKKILNDFCLRIASGEKIGIMGQSGSGKSTLVNLLLRFAVPDAGTITLGDYDIQRYPIAAYLSHFGYVRQETYLFNLSVKENIVLGWGGVPDFLIEDVIAKVGLKETIESLPGGYDAIIGTSGITFSGGQRQRLSLARALIRGPEILILDEFTSALDRELEQKLLDDIFSIFEQQTIICITHSENVAKRFERVIRIPGTAQVPEGPNTVELT